eukprot:g5630.t1
MCTATLGLLQLRANVNTTDQDGWTPLHEACSQGQADHADLLLGWEADETIVDDSGKTLSHWISDIANVEDGDRLSLERLTKLLAHAPQDRAWRRRGFVVMCCAHPDRLRLAAEIPYNPAEAIRQRQLQHPSHRAWRGQVSVAQS